MDVNVELLFSLADKPIYKFYELLTTKQKPRVSITDLSGFVQFPSLFFVTIVTSISAFVLSKKQLTIM